MHLVFVDDAEQTKPTRADMRPLVATGGIVVPIDRAGWLEAELDATCARYGFPEGEEFKWSLLVEADGCAPTSSRMTELPST